MARQYPIAVWPGVLTPEHRNNIGPAIWEFLWSIDRTTKEIIDENGNRIGLVLGGKPVTIEQIAEESGGTRATARRNIKRLVDYGYWQVTRAPHGLIIYVNKSKKWNNERVLENGPSLNNEQSLKNEPSLKNEQVSDQKRTIRVIKNEHSDGSKVSDLIKTTSRQPIDNKKISSSSDDVAEFHAYYCEVWKDVFPRGPRLTKGRRDKIRARLKTFTLDELKRACDNLHKSPWHRGEDPKNVNKVKYGTIDFLIRSDEKVDEWLNKEPPPPEPTPSDDDIDRTRSIIAKRLGGLGA